MVVLATAVCTKSGKVLVSRQFTQMTRARIDALLTTFPKLMSPDAQHTFVETEEVRYLYQPMEQLYALVISNKASNIIEDLETLRLVAKLVPETCKGSSEEAVKTHAFDLIFALDEVIAYGGYKEQVTMAQVQVFTEMESHEELLQNIIREGKYNEAREEARRKAEEIERQKQEARSRDRGLSGAGMPGTRYKGGGMSSSDMVDEPAKPTTIASPTADVGRIGVSTPTTTTSRPEEKKKTVAGLQLTKKAKKGDDFVDKFHAEEKLATVSLPTSKGPMKSGPAAAPITPSNVLSGHDNVQIIVEEKVTAALEREGAIKTLQVQGELRLTIYDPDDAKIVLHTNNALKKDANFKARLNPKMSKAAWDKEGSLALTDVAGKFPCGSDNALGLLRWRMESKDESNLPLSLNFWPSVEDGRTVVSAQFSTEKPNLTLRDVRVYIPCKSSEAPDVKQIDGEFTFDQKKGLLTWMISEISPDASTGSLEFSVPELDGDSFYPIRVEFTSDVTYSGFTVDKVAHAETGKDVKFNVQTVFGVDKYIIE